MSMKMEMISSSEEAEKFLSLGSICTTRDLRTLCDENTDGGPRTGLYGTGSSKVENADFGERTHFGSVDSECMWLSSDCSSPRSILLNENGLSGSCTLVDKWFNSWLSRVHLSNEDASLDFASTPLDLEFIHLNDLNDDADAENWLITSTKMSWPPCDISWNGCTSLKRSSSRSSSINNLDSPSFPNSDEDPLSYLVPLVNLDEEDLKLFCDVDADLENFDQSDFPSPSCRRVDSPGAAASSFSTGPSLLEATQGNSLSNLSSEVFLGTADLGNPNNEPFFWPFEGKFDWDSEETVRFLSMSPRKFIVDHKNPRGTSCKTSSVSNYLVRKASLKEEGSKKMINQFSTRSGNGKRLELINPRNIKARRKVGNM